jgi:hypothetical protein
VDWSLGVDVRTNGEFRDIGKIPAPYYSIVWTLKMDGADRVVICWRCKSSLYCSRAIGVKADAGMNQRKAKLENIIGGGFWFGWTTLIPGPA